MTRPRRAAGKVLPSTVLWAALSGGWVALCLGLYQAGRVLHVLWVPAGINVVALFGPVVLTWSTSS